MTFYCILIINQHFFIIFLASHKFLQSIGCHLNSLSATSLNLESSSSDTTLLLSVIALHSLSSSLSTNGLFRQQAPPSFPLSVSAPFIIATVRGLKPISNHSVVSNVLITTLISHLWCGRQLSSVYSFNVKLTLLHHPYFFVLIVPNQSFSRLIGLLQGWVSLSCSLTTARNLCWNYSI